VSIGPGWCHQPGRKVGAARGQKFSPTSLAERAREWFISAAAPTLSSSSQMQAYGPNCTLLCLWACWAFCGPESWPSGFLVVFRPWWPSRRHFFKFFSSFFVFFDAFFLYLLNTYSFSVILFAFRSQKL
jgi:hypothetical protein